VTVADTAARKDPALMARLLEAADAQGIELNPRMRAAAERAAARVRA